MCVTAITIYVCSFFFLLMLLLYLSFYSVRAFPERRKKREKKKGHSIGTLSKIEQHSWRAVFLNECNDDLFG